MSDPRADFESFLARVEAGLEGRPGIVGLVGMGSTAERDRVDEWSDHDLALITVEGRQDAHRAAASWLPDAERIAIEVHEHHGGVKVVYDDGHVVEYGVASVAELGGWAANAYDVRIDRGGISETMAAVGAAPAPMGPDPQRDLGILLAVALIGVGRARRGERLSANALIRGVAAEAFARAIAASVVPELDARLDSLDATRRFDLAYPAVAERMDALLASPVEDCARGLVDLAVDVLGIGGAGVPLRGLTAVRRRLGWEPRQ